MTSIKQSAPDWCFWRDGDEPAEYYRTLREIGYGAVEMVAAKRRAAARAAGLDILNQCAPGTQKGLNRLELHPSLLPEIVKTIEDAARDRIGHVIVFSGNREGQDDETGWKNCLTGARALLPHAVRCKLTLIFEMFNGFDHRDYQADSSRYGFELARAVGDEHFKVLYDAYHMHRMGEDIIADLTGNLDVVAHIHLAGHPGRCCPALPNEIDTAGIVAAVHKAGYRGYWGQEFIIQGDRFDELRRAFELAAAAAC
jgi:hydroxypyruvate isomerase